MPAPPSYVVASPKEKSTPTTEAPSSKAPSRPRIATHPRWRTHKHLARFVFLGADRFECRLDSASYRSCGPIFARHVSTGKHVLRVRAAGGGPVASFRWHVLRSSPGR